ECRPVPTPSQPRSRARRVIANCSSSAETMSVPSGFWLVTKMPTFIVLSPGTRLKPADRRRPAAAWHARRIDDALRVAVHPFHGVRRQEVDLGTRECGEPKRFDVPAYLGGQRVQAMIRLRYRPAERGHAVVLQ